MNQSVEASKLLALELLSSTILKVEGAYAPSTIRAYKDDFLSFIDFCNRLSIAPIPASPHSICLFIKQLIAHGKTSASIRRALVGISKIHQLNMLIDPAAHSDVKIEMKRMHRQLGRISQQAYPITLETLTQLIPKKVSSLRDYRDRALLLLAYDTLARRSELISYQVHDLSMHAKGDTNYYCIHIHRSKTDQEASGKVAHIRKATYLAAQEWLENAKITDGPLLRGIDRSNTVLPALGSGQINRIYKKLAQLANLDPQVIKKISGHSMRVGAAQDLLLSGASMPMIMSRGRWSKTDTVMRYIENFTSPYEET